MINLDFPNLIQLGGRRPGAAIAPPGLCVCLFVCVWMRGGRSTCVRVSHYGSAVQNQICDLGFYWFLTLEVQSPLPVLIYPMGETRRAQEGSRLFECFNLHLSLFVLFILFLFSTLLPCCGDSTCQIFLSYWTKLQRTRYLMFSFLPVAYCSTTVKYVNPVTAFGCH